MRRHGIIESNVHKLTGDRVAEVELPKFEAKSEKVEGAGILGEYDSPTLGHFNSMELTIKWRERNARSYALMAPGLHAISCYQAVQDQDPALGLSVVRGRQIAVRGSSKTTELGTMKVGAPTEGTSTFEVTFISVVDDGVSVILFDKLNGIFSLYGVDQMAATRVAMGG